MGTKEFEISHIFVLFHKIYIKSYCFTFYDVRMMTKGNKTIF